MSKLEDRKESLQATEERARKISEDSKRFDQSTKKLVWTYWIKNNLIWIVAGLTIVMLYFLIFWEKEILWFRVMAIFIET